MMNIRQRSINVNRKELLKALKKNQEIHAAEYAKAVIDFKARLLADLTAAITIVEHAQPLSLKTFDISVDFPKNHNQEYQDIIDMLAVSTDEVINIDNESFKAYFKNEWTWTSSFNSSVSKYAVGSFLKHE